MLNGEENKPIGKSGQRKRSAGQGGKKADPRKRNPAQSEKPQQDQLQVAPEAVNAPIEPIESPSITSVIDGASVVSAASVEAAVLEAVPAVEAVPVVEVVPVVETAPEEQAAPVEETAPVSYQTIANAYYSYTLQSLDRTRSFFEKLARSPNRVFELQAEFAKQSFDSFTAESQKIRELQSTLASQRLKRWEDLAARMINPPRSPTR
jgi:Phasin protein